MAHEGGHEAPSAESGGGGGGPTFIEEITNGAADLADKAGGGGTIALDTFGDEFAALSGPVLGENPISGGGGKSEHHEGH